jgi:hypothetical protein
MKRIPPIEKILLALVSASALVSPAAGATPWFSASGRFGTYAMEDVNREIRMIDALTYSRFDEISSGFGLGLGVGWIPSSGRSAFGIHYERLFAKSEITDYSGSLSYDFAANAYYGTLEYRPPSTGKALFGAGMGAGAVSSAGEISLAVTGVGAASGNVEGTGPLFQGYVFAELPIGTRAFLVPLAGYRYAKISSVELDGAPIQNPDGSDYSVDYSGFVAELGLRLMGGAH